MAAQQQQQQYFPPPPTPPLPPGSQHQQLCAMGEPTKFFELEQSVQALRPLVIDVLRTQMYHNSAAAVNLRRGIRQVREICKQLRAETVQLSKQKKGSDAGPKLEQQQQQQQQQQQAYDPSAKRPKVEQPDTNRPASVAGNS